MVIEPHKADRWIAPRRWLEAARQPQRLLHAREVREDAAVSVIDEEVVGHPGSRCPGTPVAKRKVARVSGDP
jgi:hypothetical protein